METVDNKRAKLVNSLSELVRSGKIKWDMNNGIVFAKIGNKLVGMGVRADDFNPVEFVQIYAADGSGRLDYFTDEDISDEIMASDEPPYTVMKNSRELAVRSASKIDDTLDSLLIDLGSL